MSLIQTGNVIRTFVAEKKIQSLTHTFWKGFEKEGPHLPRSGSNDVILLRYIGDFDAGDTRASLMLVMGIVILVGGVVKTRDGGVQ